jgi:hypothetical protein
MNPSGNYVDKYRRRYQERMPYELNLAVACFDAGSTGKYCERVLLLLPFDDETAEIIVFIQCCAKRLWQTTVAVSGKIAP